MRFIIGSASPVRAISAHINIFKVLPDSTSEINVCPSRSRSQVNEGDLYCSCDVSKSLWNKILFYGE